MKNTSPYKPNALGVSLQDLSLNYQNRALFDHFNLELKPGSWTCVLGSSGVGKSTLLKFLAGLPTGAESVATKVNLLTSDNQPLLGRVAYMAQQDLLMPWLNVLENVLIGFRLRGQPIAEQDLDLANTLLKEVSLEQATYMRVGQLSGGMRQRVALVRTLLENKPLVLMDEPFSALDALTRLKLQDLAIRCLMGRTVLLVTHDPLEALRLGDYIYTLNGSPAQLSKPIQMESPKPRLPNKPELLEKQGQLLSLLTL